MSPRVQDQPLDLELELGQANRISGAMLASWQNAASGGWDHRRDLDM